MEVVVFSNEKCGYCTKQKDWMLSNNIQFKEKDIQKQEHYLEFLNLKGQGTPLTLITIGDKVEQVLGFNKGKLQQMLGINNE